MNFFRILFIILTITTLTTPKITCADSIDIKCLENNQNLQLVTGWHIWEPYQFNKNTINGFKLSGIDVDLFDSIARKIGIEVNYKLISWNAHQTEFQNGNTHAAGGVTYTKERADYGYLSIPYRFEENSLFIHDNNDNKITFNNITELLSQIRLKNFNLGIVQGFVYTDPQINIFISDENNNDIIHKYPNDFMALKALLNGKIDGVLADRFAGAAALLNMKSINKVKETPIGDKTPIHFIFSKKTVPVELVDKVNLEIEKFQNTKEYNNIIKAYVYPVLLMQTIESEWFYIIGVIGTFAFALSGVAIAAKENATLFGTLLFAMLPSVGGGVMRDVLINRDEVGLFLTPSYMYYIITIVLVGFSSIRLLEYYNKDANQDKIAVKFWGDILVICDALGQAAFIVTGVAIAVMGRIEPISLWGAFFAFLTANGGGILRDLLRHKGQILCLEESLNAEVSIFWGMIFALYLDNHSYSPNPENIRNFVIFVVIGAFSSRLIAYYAKIPNIKFRA